MSTTLALDDKLPMAVPLGTKAAAAPAPELPMAVPLGTKAETTATPDLPMAVPLGTKPDVTTVTVRAPRSRPVVPGPFVPPSGVPTTPPPAPLPVVRPEVGATITKVGDVLGGLGAGFADAEATVPQFDARQMDWTSQPQAQPSAITNQPVGSTVTAPTQRSLLLPTRDRNARSVITNDPVGSTVTTPTNPTTWSPGAGTEFVGGMVTAAQTPYAMGTQMLMRQRQAMDAIDAGQPIDPNDDPWGYQAMSPAQRAPRRAELDQALSQNIGTMHGLQTYREQLPVDPDVARFNAGKSSFMDAPFKISRSAIMGSAAQLAGAVGGAALGGPTGAVLGGTATMGPAAFADDVFAQMRADGVDPSDPAARLAWVNTNGSRLIAAYGNEMGNAVLQNVLMVGPFEAARYLPRVPMNRLTAGVVGAGTGQYVAPAVQEATTGREMSEPEKTVSAVLGGVTSAAGGFAPRPRSRTPTPGAKLIPREAPDVRSDETPPVPPPPVAPPPAEVPPVPPAPAPDPANPRVEPPSPPRPPTPTPPPETETTRPRQAEEPKPDAPAPETSETPVSQSSELNSGVKSRETNPETRTEPETNVSPEPETRPAPETRPTPPARPTPTLVADPEDAITPRPRAPRSTADTTETPAEAARREAANAKDGFPPTFAEEARTERASLFNQAFREAGYDPAQAVNFPPARQFAILAKHLETKFGFKSVTANKSDMRRAIDNALDANRNLQTMAHVLGIRPEDISLGGRLSLNFEPVAGRGYLGVYRLGRRQIGLTGRSNSFAHEWTHALDHVLVQHLRRGDTQGMASGDVMGQGFNASANLNTDTATAFSRVLNALFTGNDKLAREMLDLHQQMDRYGTGPIPPELIARRMELENLISQNPSQYLRGARAVDAISGQGYFQHPWEMLARAGEAYVADRVARLGDPSKTTEFITKTDRGYLSDADPRFRLTFPKQDERALIFDAYDQLFDALRRDQIVGDGTPGSAKPTALPGNFDIIDPRHWRVSNVPPEQRGVAGALRTVAQGIAEDFRTLARAIIEPAQLGGQALRRAGIDTRGPDAPPKQAFGAARRAYSSVFRSLGGRFDTIRAAYRGNDRAQALVRNLRDLMDPQAGSGRLIRPTFGQSVNREYRARMNAVLNVLDAHGLGEMTQTQKDLLRDQLTGHGTKATPDNIVKAAEGIRGQLNDLWYYAQSKDLDVSYAAQSYFPRVLVDNLVMDNQVRFREQATKVYADQFDERIAGVTDPAERAALVQQLLTEDKITGVSQWDTSAARQAYAEANAAGWLNRLIVGTPESFDTLGPDAGYTQKRVLPSSADTHMREFYVRDPVDALSQHIRQAANRAEYTARFGKGNAKLDAMMQAMKDAGVHGQDIATLKHLTELVTGRNRTGLTTPLQRTLDWVYVAGTLGLMPRAMYASLAEPAMTAIRTRDLDASVAGFKSVLTNVFKGEDALRQKDIAEMFGIVTHAQFDTVMADRMMAGVHEGGKAAQFMANFYQRFGLTQLTNYQRVAMVKTAEVYVRNLLETSQTGKPGAQAEARAQLRELGIADGELAATHAWMTRPGNELLHAADMNNREGRLAGNALATVVDQIIQDPTRIDKPELAQNPVARFAFGLMSFNYAVSRNLHGRIWNEARRQNSFGAGLMQAASFIPGIATMFTFTLAASLLRDQMFGVVNPNTDPDDEATRAWITRPLSRAGFAGAADPLVQAWEGLRYQRSLTALTAGAQFGFFASALEKIFKPLAGENSANTNTAERNQAKGVMALMSVPIMTALTLFPGGWPSALAGQVATSARGQEWAAQLWAGEQQQRGGGSGRPVRPERPKRPERPGR